MNPTTRAVLYLAGPAAPLSIRLGTTDTNLSDSADAGDAQTKETPRILLVESGACA
jgi:hypothetical protein